MAAVMLQVISSFYAKYSKNSVFIPANKYEKHIVSKQYCIAGLDNKICFLPNCRYHFLLFDNVEEFPQKLDLFCFTYQHVECIYTLFKYRFSGNIVVKSGQMFDIEQRLFYFNQRNREVDRMPSIAKK